MVRTALVVDDSASMRQMVAYTLRTGGLTVVEAEHGEAGLRQLDAAPVNLIITDLNMPVMNGLEFIRQVRGRPNHRFTPILMLTTESQESKKMEGKAAGATGWIVKPFDPQRLLQVVSRLLP